jgi:hypothetical protein
MDKTPKLNRSGDDEKVIKELQENYCQSIEQDIYKNAEKNLVIIRRFLDEGDPIYIILLEYYVNGIKQISDRELKEIFINEFPKYFQMKSQILKDSPLRLISKWRYLSFEMRTFIDIVSSKMVANIYRKVLRRNNKAYANKLEKITDLMISQNEKNISLHKELDKKSQDIQRMKRDYELLNNEMSVAQSLVVETRRASRLGNLDYRNMSTEDWRNIIDNNRKINRKPNYSKIGRVLGKNHVTVKKWIKKKGLINY